MTRHAWIRAASLLAIVTAAGGCSYHPSFDERTSYATLEEARDMATPGRGPIDLEWSPRSFPDRVDEIGPVGTEGAASHAAIPTGPMLSTRTHELLDAAVGVSSSSGAVLTIDVREATSEYRYAIGPVSKRHIDGARAILVAEFRIGDHVWEEQFVAQATEDDSGKRGNELLESVWDDVALGVVASVMPRLPEGPVPMRTMAPPPLQGTTSTTSASTMPPPVAPMPVREPADTLTITEEMEALKRILIRKRLITEEEWEAVVGEVAGEGGG